MLFSYSKSVAIRGAVSVDNKILLLGVRGLEDSELDAIRKGSIVVTIKESVKRKIKDDKGNCVIFACMINIKRKKNFEISVYDVREDYTDDFKEIFFKVDI